MRVLVDAVLGPAHPRGIGRYVSEITRHGQGVDGTTFLLAIASWHRDYFAPLAEAGVELVEVALGARRGLRNLWHAYGVGRLARSLSADVVHVPDRLPVISTADRPLVVTVHDTAEVDVPDTFGAVQLRYRRWVLFDELKRATRIITPSNFSAGRIAALVPAAAARTSVISHGPGLDADQAESAPGGVPGERFVLFVGAVQRHKSVPLLVRAFRALNARDTNLVIAGAVNNDEAAANAAAGGDARIIRLRAVSDAQLAWLYRRAQVLVLPSRYEGFGVPVLEAMQFGCPVIVANAGALPEIAGDAALLVPRDDQPALTAALARVLDDQALRTRLTAAGRERAATFSWQRAAKDTLAAYRAAFAARSR